MSSSARHFGIGFSNEPRPTGKLSQWPPYIIGVGTLALMALGALTATLKLAGVG